MRDSYHAPVRRREGRTGNRVRMLSLRLDRGYKEGHASRNTGGGREEAAMAVARVTEIRASSPEGFQEAVLEGIKRATKTLRGMTGLEVLGKRVKVEAGKIVEYRVDMKIIFISGYAEDAFEKNLEGQKDFAFLAKPFSLKQLVEKVMEVMKS